MACKGLEYDTELSREENAELDRGYWAANRPERRKYVRCTCGKPLRLDNLNDNECAHCGETFDGNGHRLNPRWMWERGDAYAAYYEGRMEAESDASAGLARDVAACNREKWYDLCHRHRFYDFVLRFHRTASTFIFEQALEAFRTRCPEPANDDPFFEDVDVLNWKAEREEIFATTGIGSHEWQDVIMALRRGWRPGEYMPKGMAEIEWDSARWYAEENRAEAAPTMPRADSAAMESPTGLSHWA